MNLRLIVAAQLIALAAFFGLGFWVAHSSGAAALAKAQSGWADERTGLATEAATAESNARLADQVKAKAISDIAAKHEQDKANAQKDQDHVVADLRSGVVRLRDRWATCRATSEVLVAASGPRPDAASQDQAESAGRIVRAAQDADDTIRALQAVVMADRSGQ